MTLREVMSGRHPAISEAAGQLGKMVEHPNQSQPNPGLQADGTPCTRGFVNMHQISVLQLSEQETQANGNVINGRGI